MTVIDSDTFYDCSNLASVTLPSSINRIEDCAFYGCYRLTSINIPSAVTSIGWRAFADCASLTTLTLPKALQEGNIDSYAFVNSDKLVCEVYKNSGAHKFCEKAKKNKLLHDYHVIGTPTPTPTPTPVAKINISGCKVASITARVYSARAHKPSPAITYNGTKLVRSKDYKLTYANNTNVGKATITITGIGKYTGTKKVTFKINPKATSITKLTAGANRFTVSWKKRTTQTTGYQVQYSTSSNFSGAKTRVIRSTGTISLVRKGLAKNTTYYVRVRTYHKVNGKHYYSAWSPAKAVKTK